MISTIELQRKIIDNGLCVNCGACQGMCPYWQSVDGRTLKCYDCDREDGRCLRFCPRMETDTKALMDKLFPYENILPELGPFRGLYITRAADPALREHSQHGGTVTALVELALREGLMDAAVMTKAHGGLEPEGVLVTEPEKVRDCAGSSFQIPASLSVLNKALAQDSYKKIGVVATPCKALAVGKMKAQPFAENTNHAENIGLVIGLFCGWGLDWKGLAALAAENTDASPVQHMDIPPSKYHCLELDDKKVDLDQVYPLVRECCKYCGDLTARFADISVGGARSPEGWEVDKGWNQLIVRSEAGERLLRLALQKGVLETKETTDETLNKLTCAARSKMNKAKKF